MLNNKINTKFCIKYLFLIIFFSLFFIPFVSSSSSYAEVPDICLNTNYEFYDIWLEDYYSFDEYENVTLRFFDPTNDQLRTMPYGYLTTHDPVCFDVGFWLTSRFVGGFQTDLIRLETYSAPCSVDFEIRVQSNSDLNQNFNLEISDDCDDLITPPPVYYNLTDNIDNIFAYFSFDNIFADYENGYQLTNLSYLNYSSLAVDGFATATKSQIPVNLITDLTLDETFSLSLWYKPTTAPLNLHQIISCDSRDFELSSWNGHNDLSMSLEGVWHHWEYDFGNNNLELNEYSHIAVVFNSTDVLAYFNGTNIGFESYGNGSLNNCQFLNFSGTGTDYLDEVIFTSDVLTPTEITSLYNSHNSYNFSETNGIDSPGFTNLSNYYMNKSETISIDLNNSFSNWDSMYLYVDSPYSNTGFVLPTNYYIIQGDYFDLYLYENGTLEIDSFERSYNFTIIVEACNNTPYLACNNQTFNIYIDSVLGNVTQIKPFETSYNLGFYNSKGIEGNLFFQYYERLTLSVVDSNYTGLISPSLPFEYSSFEDENGDTSFMIFMSCTISDNLWNYTFLGDLNISLTCGNNNADFVFTAYNNYNDRVYFTAVNDNGFISDYTTMLSGNINLPVGYVPDLYNDYYDPSIGSARDEIESNVSFFNDNIKSFSAILPTDLAESGSMKFVFVILFVVIISTFIIISKFGVNLAITIAIFFGIVVMFFFSSVNYINVTYPVLFFVFFVLYFVLKFVRGGS